MTRPQTAHKRKKTGVSPGRRQYLELKTKYPDALLLFRIGDFYETFDDDAQTMSKVLGIALTARDVGGGQRVPLAGIPYHALNNYLSELIKAGLKVAIAEQVSDPSHSKGIVDRAVARIVTPGTIIEPGLVDEATSNFLVALTTVNERIGVAYVDLTTSQFVASEIEDDTVNSELERIAPSEILANPKMLAKLSPSSRFYKMAREVEVSTKTAEDILKRHFQTKTLEPFGCYGKPAATEAAGMVIKYLLEIQLGSLPQITSLRTEESTKYLRVDARTMRDLELLAPNHSGELTLLSVLSNALTAMGKRLLKEWISRPLAEVAAIQKRQNQVEVLYTSPLQVGRIRELLRPIPDLERLINRVRTGTATPRDVVQIGDGCAALPQLIEAIHETGSGLDTLLPRTLPEVSALVVAAIEKAPPLGFGQGPVIRAGYNTELDDLRSLSKNSRVRIVEIENDQRQQTGIRNLKIGYSKVFGYYIEVSKSHIAKVPPLFERKQTVVNGERYTIPMLKDLESRILHAEQQVLHLEKELFARILQEIGFYSEQIIQISRKIAALDVLAGFALTALENGWIKPVIDDSKSLRIANARHPVVEAALGSGEFVPNDIDMRSAESRLLVITGPNMSGKSTFIRMAGVLVILAQMGSYIPASEAQMGIADSVFTRAGISDDITGGQSTFMVEMVETATILNYATERTLAIFDEIGRGTSTYDGLAIAQAVAEHIHNSPQLACRTLFATHYNELTALGDTLPAATNLQVTVARKGQRVIFLHKILPGGSDRSYGVYVAQLAGIPPSVVKRAQHILAELEQRATHGNTPVPKAGQFSLFQPPPETEKYSEFIDEIINLDIDNITPLEAQMKLYSIRSQAKVLGSGT